MVWVGEVLEVLEVPMPVWVLVPVPVLVLVLVPVPVVEERLFPWRFIELGHPVMPNGVSLNN